MEAEPGHEWVLNRGWDRGDRREALDLEDSRRGAKRASQRGLREDRWEDRGLIGVLERLWRELDDKYPLQEGVYAQLIMLYPPKVTFHLCNMPVKWV